MEISSGRTSGFEALSRFPGPDAAPPDTWFKEAEAVGLGDELEASAVRAALTLVPRLPAGLSLSVNVSARALCSSPEITRLVTGGDSARLVLELTEHAHVEDYDALLEALVRVRAAGVRIAVDDAGSGYAGLEHILRLQPEVLKLDRTLVDRAWPTTSGARRCARPWSASPGTCTPTSWPRASRRPLTCGSSPRSGCRWRRATCWVAPGALPPDRARGATRRAELTPRVLPSWSVGGMIGPERTYLRSHARERGGPPMALPGGIWSTRDASDLVSDTEGEASLEKSIGSVGLTAMGVGAIIGTGIFVVIGQGAVAAGPAVILAFVLAAVTCLFSALSYAELAAAVPVSGSAYTYSYATMGELVAFIIGWDLILEYGVSVAAVAVGWGGNVNAFLDSAFNVRIPDAISTSPEDGGDLQPAGGVHRHGHHLAADPRHPGERHCQPHHGRHQDRHPDLLHHRGAHLLRRRQLQELLA